MSVIRSERYSAAILVAAAVAGLTIAAVLSPETWHDLHHFLGEEKLLGFITPHHVVSDLLLAVFFFSVAIELKHEMVSGELNSFKKAIIPAVSALGGVLVPVIFYLAFTHNTDLTSGWPVPTATDIAFALGILAIFGSALPNKIRIFLLALAVLDDLVAILIIATVFTAEINSWWLISGIGTLIAFGVCSYKLGMMKKKAKLKRRLLIALMLVLALATWFFVYKSGVHATIAGVALGMLLNRKQGVKAEHTLEPYVNGIILPLFALLAAMVRMPSLAPQDISGAFWGILTALPLGKLVGITLFGFIAMRLFRQKGMSLGDLLVVSSLGGIGFTVSMLMNELAFGGGAVQDQGTVAILLGSLIAVLMSLVFIRLRLRALRRAKLNKTDK